MLNALDALTPSPSTVITIAIHAELVFNRYSAVPPAMIGACMAASITPKRSA